MNSEHEEVKYQISQLKFFLLVSYLCLLAVGYAFIRVSWENNRRVTKLTEEITGLKDRTEKELAHENNAKLAMSQANWYYIATEEKHVAVISSELEGKGFRLRFDLPKGYWDFVEYPVAENERTNLKSTMFPEWKDELVGKRVAFVFPYYPNPYTVFNDRLQMNVESLPKRPKYEYSGGF